MEAKFIKIEQDYENDSQKYVKSIEHIVDIDRDKPRVEVEIVAYE